MKNYPDDQIKIFEKYNINYLELTEEEIIKKLKEIIELKKKNIIEKIKLLDDYVFVGYN